MGKVTGFLEWQRQLPKKREPDERLSDFNEFYLPQDNECSRQQAGRCMDCGIPFCQQGCPLGNHIPDWNDLVYKDRWQDAHRRLEATNNFPEFTGRLCPAPCEAACVLSINTGPVTIEQMEKEIIETAFREGWVESRLPSRRSGKAVAVVGSGPAGLAGAAQLNQAGHTVRVYDSDARMGGLLRYGIPDFKMEKWVIDRRLNILAEEGVVFVPNTTVGVDISWTQLRQDCDAILIAIGSRRPRDLNVPGRDLNGVHFAMDYLTQQNRLNAGDPLDKPHINASGKNVIILGGGDTGSDCLGTALRQDAKGVLQLELMPKPPVSRPEGNPWPRWPLVFRTSTSQQEGGERDFSVMTRALGGADGQLKTLQAQKMALGMRGGTPHMQPVEGSDFELEVDLLLLAMGFAGPDTTTLRDQLGVDLDERGNIRTDGAYATNVPTVYCAGDAHRGQSLIVWAISEGREAARAIDRDLSPDGRFHLPTRGRDATFG
ncbi:MAG: glutamate synthase subunit beta [Myxococcales bacterium]|nr:glutamate synthase subunit beta [Myxococcales bacterium]MCB9709220.1 glutamate synthase subunit beta [Myxococcales bacterium]